MLTSGAEEVEDEEGYSGFLLPDEEVIPMAEEIWAFTSEAAEKFQKRKGREKIKCAFL